MSEQEVFSIQRLNSDEIQTVARVGERMTAQEGQGQALDSLAFGGGEIVLGSLPRAPDFPRLDLDKDETGTVVSDQIDLSPSGAPVAADQVPFESSQVKERQPFSPATRGLFPSVVTPATIEGKAPFPEPSPVGLSGSSHDLYNSTVPRKKTSAEVKGTRCLPVSNAQVRGRAAHPGRQLDKASMVLKNTSQSVCVLRG